MAHDNNYLDELEKIANEIVPEDESAEAMNPDPMPGLSDEEVEAIQAQNADPVQEVEDQLPASPQDQAELQAALSEAEQNLEVAKQAYTQADESYQEFEKTAAPALMNQLPYMGAFANLLAISTDESDGRQKVASERLEKLLASEEGYEEVLNKTATELFFDNEENMQALYTQEGMEYVVEQLASFAEDEELNKVAADLGPVFTKAVDTVQEYKDATQKFWKLRNEIDAAKAHVDEMNQLVSEKAQAVRAAQEAGDAPLQMQMMNEHEKANVDWINAQKQQGELEDQRRKGAQVLGTGAAGLVGAGLLAGKKTYDARQNSSEDSEEVLSDKTAGVRINEEDSQYEGGNISMNAEQKLVQDFLKVAGAALLIDTANDENVDEGIRKQASDMFNNIARLNRSTMEEEFVKVAQSNYSREQLEDIVQGNHNDLLFDKIAYFIDVNEMSADELEKTAGADGVAAKGVAGALTDAKSNIEEKVNQSKKKTETVANGEIGNKKADDMRGYNVINNPGEYKVEKTAAPQDILQEAYMRKEAAYKEYVEADTFIRNNS
ncbi:hypothetical protein ACQKJG_18630 [Priestia megaterium]|uniref:hypothetical protein n=1 Tax=Priestia megaterium TaxID=1404 RepID=UPI003D088135